MSVADDAPLSSAALCAAGAQVFASAFTRSSKATVVITSLRPPSQNLFQSFTLRWDGHEIKNVGNGAYACHMRSLHPRMPPHA